MRTVEKRCDTRIVTRPFDVGGPRRVRVALEQGVLGLGVERRGRLVEHEHERFVAHEPARERELLPLPERDLHAFVPRGSELGVEPEREPLDDVVGTGAPDGGLDDGDARRAGRGRRDRRCRARGTRSGRSPGTRPPSRVRHSSAGNSVRSSPSTSMRPVVGRVELAHELHERRLARTVLSDDRDDGARGQVEGHVVEHEALGARIPERHVLEVDARRQAGREPARSACDVGGGGVVLEPGEPPRGVEPDPAQEPDLADGRADVLRQAAARGEHEEHRSPSVASSPSATNTIAPTYAAPKTVHASVCQTALHPPRRGDRLVPLLPCRAPLRRRASDPTPVTRTSLPGGAVVPSTNRCRASRLCGAPRSSAARSMPGRHEALITVGSANTTSSTSAGWIDASSDDRDDEPQRSSPSVEKIDMKRWSSANT